MAQPKGSRNTTKPSEEPVKLEQIELVCKVTGKTFHTYKDPDGTNKDPLLISPEGFAQLSEDQVTALQAGARLEDIL